MPTFISAGAREVGTLTLCPPYESLAEETRTIIMEKNRMKLFEAVQAFLDEAKRS